jgi:hypothetical protein
MFKNTNLYIWQFVFSGDNTKVHFRVNEPKQNRFEESLMIP